MSNSVLLVVDVQTALIQEHPFNEEKVIMNIKGLISIARDSNKEVVYVRHDDGIGEELEYGTDGWQIYNEIAPNKDEKVFGKKYNSTFFKTGLNEYLETKKIDTIILMGLQTEYCIDSTLKSAFEDYDTTF
jgi:nicotinamidase-related amidase